METGAIKIVDGYKIEALGLGRIRVSKSGKSIQFSGLKWTDALLEFRAAETRDSVGKANK